MQWRLSQLVVHQKSPCSRRHPRTTIPTSTQYFQYPVPPSPFQPFLPHSPQVQAAQLPFSLSLFKHPTHLPFKKGFCCFLPGYCLMHVKDLLESPLAVFGTPLCPRRLAWPLCLCHHKPCNSTFSSLTETARTCE